MNISQGAAYSRLRRNVQNYRAERRAAHAPVRNPDNVLHPFDSQLLGYRNIAGLGHARSAFGADVLENTDVVGMDRSEAHTSELQSLMRISYAVFCLKKKIYNYNKALNQQSTR